MNEIEKLREKELKYRELAESEKYGDANWDGNGGTHDWNGIPHSSSQDKIGDQHEESELIGENNEGTVFISDTMSLTGKKEKEEWLKKKLQGDI